ncbi:MAG: arsenate reductase (glutaredoxin) [Cyclobacteriaceae bacterium]|nr:arsenate reductase (glutaredoxin) [Cyclobacteriaceae bacterium HetDA_MAG_MS6]
MTEIYHNPRCGKSRQTLKLLHERGEQVTVVEYIKFCPSREKLKEILKKLNMQAEDIIRKGEPIYQEKYKGKALGEEEWIDAMVEDPILIERPIVVKAGKAAIGRPPEEVISIL